MLKIGEYFRTPWGDIGKITNIPKHNKYLDDGFCLEGKFITCGSEAMKELNSIPNIIDLIEVGDYVNGECVYSRCETKLWLDGDTGEILIIDGEPDEPIKSIVTKEKFESMEYKVGE